MTTNPDGNALPPGAALVIGASGGLGAALVTVLAEDGRFEPVIAASRTGPYRCDVTDEGSVADLADAVSAEIAGAPLRLVLIATGFLHDERFAPERSLASLSPEHLAKAFAVNAIGPALVFKHMARLLPREGKSAIAALSAKVGSIGDNRLGGWHSYRASKAALNQIVRTSAIEIARRRPEAVCLALHPGTTDTRLSAPFEKKGLDVVAPSIAARRLLAVIDGARASDSGGFFDYRAERLPW